MASNKFFTIMIVPEKSNKVAKVVIPSYIFKGGILALAFLGVLATIMVLDYANVMNQINENKQLKVENRQLRQSVQVFKTKMVTIENTLDRVKTFVTKLRIITNIEDTSGPASPVLEQPSTPSFMPGAPTESAEPPATAPKAPLKPIVPASSKHSSNDLNRAGSRYGKDIDVVYSHDEGLETSAAEGEEEAMREAEVEQPPSVAKTKRDTYEAQRSKRLVLLAALMTETPETFAMSDADTSVFVQKEFERLDSAYDEVNGFALAAEQETQDILERLGEKRTLLASTPTRIPTLGYITSDYGIRVSPFDGRRKMHEGIDIANRYGADVIAPADGTVKFSGVKPGYGKIVILDHGNGIETRFAHNSKGYVNVGDRVRRGQKIAAIGNTGHSTGPHCHYEVHANGLPVDPCWYILDYSHLCRR